MEISKRVPKVIISGRVAPGIRDQVDRVAQKLGVTRCEVISDLLASMVAKKGIVSGLVRLDKKRERLIRYKFVQLPTYPFCVGCSLMYVYCYILRKILLTSSIPIISSNRTKSCMAG